MPSLLPYLWPHSLPPPSISLAHDYPHLEASSSTLGPSVHLPYLFLTPSGDLRWTTWPFHTWSLPPSCFFHPKWSFS